MWIYFEQIVTNRVQCNNIYNDTFKYELEKDILGTEHMMRHLKHRHLVDKHLRFMKRS